MLWRSGEGCVALAAFLFSVSSLFVKLTSGQLSVFQICTLASGGCALLLLAASRLSPQRIAPSSTTHQGGRINPSSTIHEGGRTTPCSTPGAARITALIALRAILGAVTILCYYAAVELGDIRDATALFFTSPLFTLVFDALLHRTLPTAHHVLSAALTAAGALMISRSCICLLLGGSGLASASGLCAGPANSGVHNASLTLPAAPFQAPSAAASTSTHYATPLLQQFLGSSTGAADGARLGAAPPALSSADLLSMALALTAAATNSGAFLSIQAIGQAVPALTLTFWHHAATAAAAAASQLGLALWLHIQAASSDAVDPVSPTYLPQRASHPSFTNPYLFNLSHPASGSLHTASGATIAASGIGSRSAPEVPDTGVTPSFVVPGLKDAMLVAGVMAAQLLAQLLLNRGFSLTSPTRGAAINVLQVVFSFVWDSAVFGNPLQPTSMVGGGLIMAGVLLQALAAARKQRRLQGHVSNTIGQDAQEEEGGKEAVKPCLGLLAAGDAGGGADGGADGLPRGHGVSEDGEAEEEPLLVVVESSDVPVLLHGERSARG